MGARNAARRSGGAAHFPLPGTLGATNGVATAWIGAGGVRGSTGAAGHATTRADVARAPPAGGAPVRAG
ncbi:hypothetical protein FRAAL1815 [Frankia alni ACN14a]|uniref:Uncharacterized protein n=1 Tax=Frankia alni (strain DSM 45986 / CECT 9034 / ACN14a) TaxID=326424 RepID=Q0RPR4_FRAAA|nr:hypothetical protein FRAAL1815 [Frankia alni ACN14a]